MGRKVLKGNLFGKKFHVPELKFNCNPFFDQEKIALIPKAF